MKKKLLKLHRKANEIYNNDRFSWEKKFDKIFSDKISVKINSLIRLDYYDPDTTYEDDVCAYITALNDYVVNLSEKEIHN